MYNISFSEMNIVVKPPYNPNWSVHELAMNDIPEGWEMLFYSMSDELLDISNKLDVEVLQNGPYYPPKANIFRAFHLVRPENVRVVIIGQDPYPGDNVGVPYADGLAFSVNRIIPIERIPASLKNIFRELQKDYPNISLQHGDLTSWALQGVLMLNTCLTVRPGKPGSHGKIWYGFIMSVLAYLRDIGNDIVYVLWGKEAQTLTPYLGNKAHILASAHPSPQSYSLFKDNKHFLKINMHFQKHNQPLINWELLK